MNLSLNYGGPLLLFLALVATGTTILGNSSTQVWADVFEGTEGSDFIIGTLEDYLIDSKGGNDDNFGGIGWPFNLTFLALMLISFNPKAKHALYMC
jgi:hypothetical protein